MPGPGKPARRFTLAGVQTAAGNPVRLILLKTTSKAGANLSCILIARLSTAWRALNRMAPVEGALLWPLTSGGAWG